jgi:AbrB family looped-hinge helix DNA binding protein
MKTTIDKAGRVVVPAPLREKAGLRPGTELDVILEDGGIRLIRRVSGPRLERAGSRWVARPTVPTSKLPEVDVAALVEEERNRWP